MQFATTVGGGERASLMKYNKNSPSESETESLEMMLQENVY